FFSYTLWLAQNFCILERTISTIFLESYDGRFRSSKDQVKYFVFFVFVDILQITFTMVNKYCILALVILHASLNCTMSFLLLRANRKADRIESRLGVRYQVKENLKVLRVFAPLAAVCVFWQILTCLLFSIPAFTSDESIISYTTGFFLFTSELYPLSVSLSLLLTEALGAPYRLRFRRKEQKVEP
ncbi:hypothetical protein PENTCL1PPCAC_16455, partial [Pristionchus entomophagus]